MPCEFCFFFYSFIILMLVLLYNAASLFWRSLTALNIDHIGGCSKNLHF
jgi:hypothetical protein